MLTKGPDGARSIDCLEEVIVDWGPADRLDPLKLSRSGDVYSLGLREESDLFSLTVFSWIGMVSLGVSVVLIHDTFKIPCLTFSQSEAKTKHLLLM